MWAARCRWQCLRLVIRSAGVSFPCNSVPRTRLLGWGSRSHSPGSKSHKTQRGADPWCDSLGRLSKATSWAPRAWGAARYTSWDWRGCMHGNSLYNRAVHRRQVRLDCLHESECCFSPPHVAPTAQPVDDSWCMIGRHTFKGSGLEYGVLISLPYGRPTSGASLRHCSRAFRSHGDGLISSRAQCDLCNFRPMLSLLLLLQGPACLRMRSSELPNLNWLWNRANTCPPHVSMEAFFWKPSTNLSLWRSSRKFEKFSCSSPAETRKDA